MMAGARVAMMASAILQDGYEIIPAILTDLQAWMETYEYKSIQQMQGSMSQQSVAEPAAFERSNYIQILNEFRQLP
jgi:dihydroorotate dehydrogenase (fumarate)